MNKDSAILTVPNTKEGLDIIKYLAKQIVDNEIFVRLVTKKEFNLIVKHTKGDAK